MFLRPGKRDGADARERSLWGDLISLGLVFPIAIVLGLYLGRWIGGMFGHSKPGMYIGLAWGVITGFWELFKVTKRLDKYDKLTNSIKPGDNGDDSDAGGGPDGK